MPEVSGKSIEYLSNYIFVDNFNILDLIESEIKEKLFDNFLLNGMNYVTKHTQLWGIFHFV